ncbi:hypothetical protein QTJ16_002734 [Diplocarpon rosae]|uniref:Uncharacterized protein n=1 Tax=Diplocarpon rosae TaxID=946125 RepID=A0AAD9T0Z0_9HELO|nr:hypothetical protein QTJ16_002734 [Diplocarpon rosae]
MAGKRIFEEVHVGNFHGQRGRERLYFAVYGDALHITIPRDLRQTLPAAPDLIIDLPRTEKASEVPGCLDRVHAHDVNNVKVGALGDHEILLMGCDDGDVIAYYTHQLAREATKAGGTRGGDPVKPFFHENVGISAWGLAIHKVSRLIATGTNFREVIVFSRCWRSSLVPLNSRAILVLLFMYIQVSPAKIFALLNVCISEPGIATGIDANAERRCDDDHDGCAVIDPLSSKTQLYTPVDTLGFGGADGGLADHYRQMNTRLRLPLGPRGHNVPSIDFLSDDRGGASMVVAVDINGKLWSLDLTTAEALESPPIEVPQIEPWNSDEDELERRGWGVICVSADAFKLVQTPQEALGVPKMTDAFKSSVTDVRENSSIHPPLPPALIRSTPVGETSDDMLELESDESPSTSMADDLAFGQKKLFVLSLLRDYKTSSKYTLSRPAHVPHLTDRNWVEGMIQMLESESWCQDARVQKWVEETERLVNEQWDRGTTLRSDAEALQFFFKLPTEVRHRFNNWNEIRTAPLMQTVPEQPPAAVLPGLIDSPRLMRARDGTTAIIRMNSYDNMYHVISEISLLVVASQKGRVGLFTLTRLEDCFSRKTAPILMFRLDRILPLCTHEGDYRPMSQLLGMAVAPLQGRGSPYGAAQRKIWRLVLHYMDHSVLSYELKRQEGDRLVVL